MFKLSYIKLHLITIISLWDSFFLLFKVNYEDKKSKRYSVYFIFVAYNQIESIRYM